MKISELIAQLTAAQQEYGDLPVSTWDGFVSSVKIVPAYEGILILDGNSKPDEINLEFYTKL